MYWILYITFPLITIHCTRRENNLSITPMSPQNPNVMKCKRCETWVLFSVCPCFCMNMCARGWWSGWIWVWLARLTDWLKKSQDRQVMEIRGWDGGTELRQEHWGDITWLNSQTSKIKALDERQRGRAHYLQPLITVNQRVRLLCICTHPHMSTHYHTSVHALS